MLEKFVNEIILMFDTEKYKIFQGLLKDFKDNLR